MSDILKRLEEEEKEAEKLLYEDTDEESQENQERVSSDTDGYPEDADDKAEVDSSEDGKQVRTSWKKRFTSYKASTDQTIHQLRQEIARRKDEEEDLKEQVRTLSQQIISMRKEEKKSPEFLEDLVSKEEAELLGPEAVAVLKKFAAKMVDKTQDNPEVNELHKELAELREERKREKKRREEEEQRLDIQAFKEKLVRAVPDFDDIDPDPKFGEYLEGIDDASGMPRRSLYVTAIHGRDVLGVARFYNDFRKTKPKSRNEILEEGVSPEGRAAESVQLDDRRESKKRYHIADYEKLMDDYTKGIYKGREDEFKRIEKRFDKAFVEGRVDGL